MIQSAIVSWLLNNTHQSSKLRSEYIFIIIPCLNPDGVVFGNYRTNICGYDLNRCWENPREDIMPEIYYLK